MEIPLPATDNFWLALLVFVLFGSPAVFSKTAAKIPGFLGAAGRWWQRRAAESSPERKVITATNLDRIIDARVDEKVGHVVDEVKDLRQDVDDYAAYLTYDAGWHRETNIYAAQEGFSFPPPPHLTFTQWREQRERGDQSLMTSIPRNM